MKLTKSQIRSLSVLDKRVCWTPGEGISNSKGKIRMDVLRKLKNLGLAITYDLHPYGKYPIYGATLNDEGKKVLEIYNN